MGNSEDLIRLLLLEQSDLGLHCLPRPMYPNISSFYGRFFLERASDWLKFRDINFDKISIIF